MIVMMGLIAKRKKREWGGGITTEKRLLRRIWKSTDGIDSLRNRMDRKRMVVSNVDLQTMKRELLNTVIEEG